MLPVYGDECPIPNNDISSDFNTPIEGIEVYAKKATISQDSFAEFLGNVEILSTRSRLAANSAFIDKTKKIVAAYDNIIYQNESMQIVGDGATLDFDTGSVSFDTTTFEMMSFNGRGSAEQIRLNEDDGMLIKGIAFSTCPENDKDWEIRADSFQIAPGKSMAVTKGTRFYIDDVPIFYLPYFSFPATDLRQSGLLFPKLSNRDRTGFSYEQPYYFNILPNVDMTLSPRLMALKGLQLKSELRYLSEHHQGAVNVEYLSDNDFIGSQKSRYFSRFQHRTTIGKQWYLNVDVNNISDSNYITDLGSEMYSRTDTHLAKQLHLQYISDSFTASIATTDFAVLGDHQESYRTLPEIQFVYNAINQQNIKLDIQSELAEFTSKQVNSVSATRFHIEPTLSVPIRKSWGEAVAEAKLFHTQYRQDNVANDQLSKNVTRSIWQGRLYGQLNFERDFTIAGKSWYQTLEPKIQYLYTQHAQQNDIGIYDSTEMLNDFNGLFRGRQYTGLDRIDHNNQVTIGLTTRVFDDNEELFSLSLGQIFNIEQYNIEQPKSDTGETEKSSLAAELNWNISEQWELRTQLQLSNQNSNVEKTNIVLDYQPQSGKLVQLSHRFAKQISRQQIQQSGITVAWPLAKDWQGVTRVFYDGAQDQVIESYFGFQYQSCCWSIQVGGGRSLVNRFNETTGIGAGEFDTNITINFIFSGLGGDNAIMDLLQGGLFGYHRPYSLD